MRHPLRLCAAALAFVSALAADPGAAAAKAAYTVKDRWNIGGDGGWDLLTVDGAARRLYLSRSDRVVVVNADTGKQVGEIPHTDGVHGIAIAADLGRGFTSNGKSNSITVFDLKTLEQTSVVKVDGQNPDVILYEPREHRVYTFNGRSANVSVIDAKSLAPLGAVALDGKPEFALSDGHGRLFVNIEDKSELLALDTAKLNVGARWKLEGCEEPTGLAFDGAHARLFSVCQNQQMIVTDSKDGHRVASVTIGKGPDGAVFDRSRGLVFSPNGADGSLTIVHVDDADHFRVIDTVATKKSARTIALDEKTHRLYLPSAEFGEAPPATPEQPHPRAPMAAGTFTVLVVGD